MKFTVNIIPLQVIPILTFLFPAVCIVTFLFVEFETTCHLCENFYFHF